MSLKREGKSPQKWLKRKSEQNLFHVNLLQIDVIWCNFLCIDLRCGKTSDQMKMFLEQTYHRSTDLVFLVGMARLDLIWLRYMGSNISDLFHFWNWEQEAALTLLTFVDYSELAKHVAASEMHGVISSVRERERN